MNVDLMRILEGKEQRWNRRQELSEKYQETIISITFCVPEKIRNDEKYIEIFTKLKDKFKAYLLSENIKIIAEEALNTNDGKVFFIITDENAIILKKKAVAFEEKHRSCRILDIDIMDKNKNPISREDINLPPRKCFICEKAAAICVSQKTHSKDEVFKKALKYINYAEDFVKK